MTCRQRHRSSTSCIALYDAVVYASGAETDRHLGIPGEELAGSHAATEFVGWYNGHPDYRDRRFELDATSAVVVGMGNVAMDVTRILASSMDELTPTDISRHALDALRASKVGTIYVLGRRGPAQAAFTNPELKELGELAEADVIVDPREIELDEHSAHQLSGHEDRAAEKNLHTLREFAARKPRGPEAPHRAPLPRVARGDSRQQSRRGREAREEPPGAGARERAARPRPPGRRRRCLPASSSVRWDTRACAIPGVPFDQRAGVIPNVEGRVLVAPGASEMLAGVYAVGWIKRGPSGVIGTNKPDSAETADRLLEDVAQRRLTPKRARQPYRRRSDARRLAACRS